MFDGIHPNARILCSRFDQEEMISFQMSLPSDILSFQRWNFKGKDLELYYDRRDVSVLYLFVEGSYVGEAHCQAFMGQRVSEWEAKAMRSADAQKAKEASTASREVRARMQEEIAAAKKTACSFDPRT